MSTTARMLVDPTAVSMAATIRTAAHAAPCLVIQQHALVDRATELGGMEAAAGFLLTITEELDKPIGVNVAIDADRSSTTFLAPGHWAPERLSGWVAGHHVELEAQFGASVPSRSNWAERRKGRRN